MCGEVILSKELANRKDLVAQIKQNNIDSKKATWGSENQIILGSNFKWKKGNI